MTLIFSCGEKEDKNNTDKQKDNKSEKGCENTIPDYTIKAEDFIQSIENKKDVMYTSLLRNPLPNSS